MPRQAKQLQKRYKGQLNKPLRRKAIPNPPASGLRHFLSKEEYEELQEKHKKSRRNIQADNALNLTKQAAEKLGLLLEHYEIDKNDPDRWFLLSLALARNHVTGFQIKEDGSAGRRVVWNENKLVVLYFEVVQLIKSKNREPQYGISWACAQLVKRPEWRNFEAKTLQTKYSEAKKSGLVRLLIDVLENIPMDTIHEATEDIITAYSKLS